MTNRYQKRKYRLKKIKSKKKKKKKRKTKRSKKKVDLCFDCKKNKRNEYGSHCLMCHEKEIENYKHCEICEEPWRNC